MRTSEIIRTEWCTAGAGCESRIRARLDVVVFFFFQAEDGIRDLTVTGVQTCALPICRTIARAIASSSTVTTSSTRRLMTSKASAPGCFTAMPSAMVEEGAVIRRRSEERRVGEEGRSRWAPDHLKKKKE